MIADARILSIDSKAGHFICCGDDPVATELMNEEIAAFLSDLES